MNPHTKKRLLLIFTLAVVVRVVYVLISSHGVHELFGDAFGYHSYALNVLQNGTYVNDIGWRAHRVPGYPMFLALVYFIFGIHVAPVQYIQVLLSAIACTLIYWAARELVPENFALMAGLAAVFYFDLIQSVARLLSETLYIFIISLLFAIGFKREKLKHQEWAMGLLSGILTMIRPEGMFVGFIYGASLLWKHTRRAFIFFLAFVPLLGIWTVRNYFLFHRVIVGTTLSGACLYYGLQRPLVDQGLASADSLLSDSMDEIESNDSFMRKGRLLQQQFPLSKKIKIWLYGFSVLNYPFLPEYDVTMVMLGPFWLMGLWAALKRKEMKSWAVVAFVLGSMAMYVLLGGVQARYRQPFAPGLILLAAMGAFALSEKIHSEKFKYLLAGWLILNVAIWPFASQIRAFVLSVKPTFG